MSKNSIFHVLTLFVYIVMVLITVPRNAAAYIDPSATTFLIQAIVGVVVALTAGISIYWRKAKKKVNKMIGRDENTGKNAESDDIDL